MYALSTDDIREHSCIVRGLSFYMPRCTMGEPKNALTLYEQSEPPPVARTY